MQRALFFLSACILLIACQKEISKETTNKTTNTAKCKLVKMVQGTGVNDTIYLLKYDNLGRVIKIVDSSSGTPYDLITISYNGSSKLPSSANLLGFDSVTFTYNASGKVATSIERGVFDTKYVFEYVSDTILKKINLYEWSPNINDWISDGADTAYLDGIRDVLQFKAAPGNGTYIPIDEFTYTNVANTLKVLSQFDNGGVLGIFDIFPRDWYYYESNFMVHTYNGRISPDYRECSYNVDSLGNVTSSLVTFRTSPTDPIITVTTRKYYYDCTK
jgi:hypothetical protein